MGPDRARGSELGPTGWSVDLRRTFPMVPAVLKGLLAQQTIAGPMRPITAFEVQIRLLGEMGAGGDLHGSFLAVTWPLGATVAFVNIDGLCEPSPRRRVKLIIQCYVTIFYRSNSKTIPIYSRENFVDTFLLDLIRILHPFMP